MLKARIITLGSTNHDGYINGQIDNAHELNINGKGIIEKTYYVNMG